MGVWPSSDSADAALESALRRGLTIEVVLIPHENAATCRRVPRQVSLGPDPELISIVRRR